MAGWWVTPQGRSRDVIARHLPPGPAWRAFRVAGKRAYRMLTGLSGTYEDAWQFLSDLLDELTPYTTDQLITEWETAVSLPDACLPKYDTLAERRAWVVWRLTKKRWQTAQDWKDLAILFGLEIRVTPGWLVQRPALFNQTFDYIFWDMPRLGRFRVYVDIIGGCGEGGFDYDYDYAFPTASPNCQALMCLIERVAPANVVIVWNADPVGNGWLNTPVDDAIVLSYPLTADTTLGSVDSNTLTADLAS